MLGKHAGARSSEVFRRSVLEDLSMSAGQT